MLCSLSNLKKEQVDAIRSLEGRLGKTLLAYSCKDARMAPLSDDDLKEIKTLESQLGVALIAVNA